MEHVDLTEQTLSAIGEGAMSRVYAAVHPVHGEIAVKLLRQADADSWRRMQREAAAQARLDHPHIGRVYGFGDYQGQPAILMQRVHGRPLDEVAAELGLEARVQLFVQVCDAVEHAHAAGLVHRDLKPANILVEERVGRLHPFVLDFGLVRDDSDGTLTAAGELLGTPAYMSPEQARGDARHVDRRSDVFSLGAILFHLLVGRPPFSGGSVSEVIGRILTEDAPLAHLVSTQVPQALSRICAQCLERDPARRYASARVLRADLDRWLRGDSLVARSVGWRYRAGRWLRRNRATGAASAAALLVLFAAIAWITHDRIQARERETVVARISGASEALGQRMRLARLAPPQSLQPTVAALSEALERLQPEARTLRGESAARAGKALARAWMDLDHPQRALELLRPALAQAPEDVELHRSLASAMVRLVEARRAALGDRDEAEIDELLGADTLALRDEAEAILARAARLDPDTPPLARARLALLRQRHDEALEDLSAWQATDVVDYAGPALEAEVLFARSRLRAERGELQAAAEDVQQASVRVQQALAIGRSDIGLLVLACRIATAGIRLDAHEGRKPPATPNVASPACDDAPRVRPDQDAGWLARALAWSAISRGHRIVGDTDAELAALEAMRDDAERAVELGGDRPEPGRLLARVRIRIAEFRLGGFEDSLALYDAALRDLEQIDARHPDQVAVLTELATGYRQRGRLKANFQRDGGDDMATAAGWFQRALALRPDSVALADELSLTWVFAFYQARTVDPELAREVAGRAIAALDPLLESHPDHPDLLATQSANLGDLWAYLYSLQLEMPRVDPHAALRTRAHELAQRLRQLAPQRPEGHFGPAMIELTRAELRHERGQRAPDALETVAARFAGARDAGLEVPSQLAAWRSVEQARDLLLAGRDASAEIARARALVAPARDHPTDVDARMMGWRAELELAAAEVQAAAARGQVDAAAIERGLEAYAALEASGRDFGDGLCDGGLLHAQRAQALGGSARRQALDMAVAAYRRCIDASPFVLAYQQPRLEAVEQQLAELPATP